MNDSINLLNVGNSTHFTEVNTRGIVSIPVIKRIVENYYTHILHFPFKIYISGYVISKLTITETAIYSVM